MIELEIQTADSITPLVPDGADETLDAAVRAALGHEGVDTAVSLTLLLTDDAHLHQLNRDFLAIDRPTDVLSFPDGETLPGETAVYLGDVAISLETAVRQAAAGGHSLLAELQLLAVHGVLHLLGHDHADAEEKAAMWAAQSAVLMGLGTAVIIPDEG